MIKNNLPTNTMRIGTETTFGYAWNIYREILPLHREQFLGWITPVHLSFFKGKRFLDAGCGIGRNSFWPLQAGAESAYVFDFDERTVNVAKENLKPYSNCQVGFESIYDLAARNEFDIAMSIGVIHHLADPRKAVSNLVQALKPGGKLILWVYARDGNERYLFFFDRFRRWITSRLPMRITLFISQLLTCGLILYLQLPHRNSYLQSMKKRSFRHIEAIVFDQLIPEISNYWKKEEVEALIKDLPVHIETLTLTHGMSWTLVAQKIQTDSSKDNS